MNINFVAKAEEILMGSGLFWEFLRRVRACLLGFETESHFSLKIHRVLAVSTYERIININMYGKR